MIQMYPVTIDSTSATAICVQLPKTNLVIVTTDIGYIMCGALDVQLLNDRLADRGIVAGRAVGVRTIDQLLEAPLESVTSHAQTIGIQPGMKGRDAIRLMLNLSQHLNDSPSIQKTAD
jgi:uncharacterized protein YunC (DUF1805 family)